MSLPLKARVRNGRIVLDKPADLPEGATLEVTVLEGSNDTSPDDAVTVAMDAALAQLTPEEIEADLRVVRASARATMKRGPW